MSAVEKSGLCKSLSGGGTLTYHIGGDDDKGQMVRLYQNSGTGLFSKDWVSFDEIHTLLRGYQEPFTSQALSPLFKGKSANSAGFLMAVLLKEGVVVEATGRKCGFVLEKSIAGLAKEATAGGICHPRTDLGSDEPDPGQVGEV